jgi:hypothetical protein
LESNSNPLDFSWNFAMSEEWIPEVRESSYIMVHCVAREF